MVLKATVQKQTPKQSLPTVSSEDVKSSRTQMYFKIGALRNFAIFTGKHLCWSLFLIKLQASRPATSKTWTRTRDSDLEEPGPGSCAQTLKNLHHGKPGS